MKLKKNFLSYLLLFIGIMIFTYSLYKSEIYFSGLNRKFYQIYFYISLIFILLSLSSFYLSKKIRVYLTITFVSLIISLYAFEIYLNFYQVNYKSSIYKKKTGKKFDNRSKLEFFSYFKKKNSNIVLFNYIENPNLKTFSGISNSKTIGCSENGYFSTYNSDDYGFNNPKYNLEEDNFEYVLIGDSFVHGDCVNRPFDIASILRVLSNKNSLNLGIGGTGPLKQYAIIKEYLPQKFKKLLLFYYVNDNEDLIRELKNDFLIKYLNDENFTQDLKNKQYNIDILNHKEINLKFANKNSSKKINLKNTIKLFKTRNLLFNKANVRQVKASMPEEYFAILKKIKKIVELNNASFYLVILPSYSQIKQGKIINQNFEKFKKKLISEEINVIDVQKLIFDVNENPLKFFPFEKPGHYNKEAYSQIGKLIYKLTKNE
mgnify:CR=1 FL=1